MFSNEQIFNKNDNNKMLYIFSMLNNYNRKVNTGYHYCLGTEIGRISSHSIKHIICTRKMPHCIHNYANSLTTRQIRDKRKCELETIRNSYQEMVVVKVKFLPAMLMRSSIFQLISEQLLYLKIASICVRPIGTENNFAPRRRRNWSPDNPKGRFVEGIIFTEAGNLSSSFRDGCDVGAVACV